MGLQSWPQEYDKQLLNIIKKRKTSIAQLDQELYIKINKIQINNTENHSVDIHPEMFTLQIQLLRKTSSKICQLFSKNNYNDLLQKQSYLKLKLSKPIKL